MPESESAEVFAQGLYAYLHSVIPQATDIRIGGLYRIGGGNSRENWPFDVEWTEADGAIKADLILRRDPPASLLESNSLREFETLRVLHQRGLPVPEPLWIDEQGDWLERPFMILRRHNGVVDRRILTNENKLGLDKEARRVLAEEYCEFLVRLHSLDVATLPFAVPVCESVAALAVDEWEQRAKEVRLEAQPELALAFSWLRAHLPQTARIALVHGDYRPGNSLVTADGIEVILDWETAHLGDPLEDIGWHLAPYYRKEHLIPGAWERPDFLATYSRSSGSSIDERALEFWIILSNVKICVMALSGIKAFLHYEADRVTSPAPRLFHQLVRSIVSVESARETSS